MKIITTKTLVPNKGVFAIVAKAPYKLSENIAYLTHGYA
jgi:hypothetical protein